MSVMMSALSQTVSEAVGPIQQAIEEPPENPLRLASDVAGGLLSVFSLPEDLLNTGFAVATDAIAQALPSFPAATLGSMYLGMPHGHMHPPSLIPPAPVPVPLPSLGAVMLGTCVQVLIGGLPAARAGDQGFAPTCCGFFPAFEVVTGSSKVFIGGTRAARMTDLCKACLPSIGGPIRGLAKVMEMAGNAVSLLSAGADVVDSIQASDAAMASAHALSAAMQTAQVAADMAALAVSSAMGSDPAVPPLPISGSLMIGVPNVLIGGFPMPNFPNPAEMLLDKLGSLKKKKKAQNEGCGREGEPVDVVSGANVDDFLDYQLPGPSGLEWRRHYSSHRAGETGPMGRGFRHHYDHRLRLDLDGFHYEGPDGAGVAFPPIPADRGEVSYDGLTLRQGPEHRLELCAQGRPTLEFELPRGYGPALLRRIRAGAHTLDLHYDRERRLSRLIDDLGRTVLLTYDPPGLLIDVRVRPADGGAELRLASYRYDPQGRLIEWKDAAGQPARYEYDASHRMTRKVDRRGYAFTYAYDDAGRCIHTHGDDGLYEERFEYHPTERFTLQRSHRGGLWQHFYDENGTILKRVDPYGGSLTRKQSPTGDVIEEVDAAGSATRLLYDADGRHFARLGPLGDLHPPLDEAPHPPDPLEHRMPSTAREWHLGRVLPAPRALPDRHDPLLDRFIDVLDPGVTFGPELRSGNPWADRKEILSRARIEGDGWTWERLDGLGRVVEEVDAQGRRRRFQFDALGRLTGREEADGSLERWRYDEEGNLLEHRDRDGATTHRRYTSWNLIEREWDGNGLETCYAWDAREQPTRVVDPGGTASEYEYDAKDRLVKVTRCGRVRETYHYDQGDNLIEKRDGAGRVLLSFQYGPDHLKRERQLAGGDLHRFEYNARGRITRAEAGRCVTERAFDARGRRTVERRDGRGVEHTFRGGMLKETTWFGRYVARYEPDGNGGVVVTDPTGGLHRFEVSPAGLAARIHPNGLAELSQYDEAGRCRSRLRLKRGERSWLRREVFRYSPAGDLVEIEGGEAVALRFEYDPGHRLIRETRPDGYEARFRYDAAGNLLEKPGLFGGVVREGNRLRQANGEHLEYDARDRLSRRHGAGGVTTYHYDARDQLVEVRSPRGVWQASYDPLGRRVETRWQGRRTEYWWDGDRLAAERDPGGALRIYLYPDEVALVPFMLLELEGEGAPPSSARCYYLRTDPLGQVVGVEDAEGDEVWRAQLEPYGLMLAEEGSFRQPLRWPGHYFDAETGLHYNRFRYYSPELGRYLQPDPLGLAGGLNLYAYPSSPLSRVDLRGLHDEQPDRHHKRGEGEDGSDTEQPPKKKPDPEVQKKVREIVTEYDDKIKAEADPEKQDDLRYERYQKKKEAEGKQDTDKTPEQQRAEWDKKNEQIKKNREKGREAEEKVLGALGLKHTQEKFPKTDGKGNVIPDALSDSHVLEVKATDQDVFYLTEQIRSEAEGADSSGKQLAVILVNDDPSSIRPSRPLAELAGVYHFKPDPDKTNAGEWSKWEKGKWVKKGSTQVHHDLGIKSGPD